MPQLTDWTNVGQVDPKLKALWESGTYRLQEPQRAAFVFLMTARAFKAGDKPKFQAQFMFQPGSHDLKMVQSIAGMIAKKEWPGRNFNDPAWPFRKPYKDGTTYADRKLRDNKDGKDKAAYARGLILLDVHSINRPQLGYINFALPANERRVVTLDPNNEDEIRGEMGKFYSGVEAFATLKFAAYRGGGGADGVTTYLQSFVSTCVGERLGGGQEDIASVYSGYAGAISEADPTAGMAMADDEIPF